MNGSETLSPQGAIRPCKDQSAGSSAGTENTPFQKRSSGAWKRPAGEGRLTLLLICGILLFLNGILNLSDVSAAEDGGIVIERQSRKSNPTLLFRGVSGDAALSEKVRNNLLLCGWFDLIKSGAGDYLVSGTASGLSLIHI